MFLKISPRYKYPFYGMAVVGIIDILWLGYVWVTFLVNILQGRVCDKECQYGLIITLGITHIFSPGIYLVPMFEALFDVDRYIIGAALISLFGFLGYLLIGVLLGTIVSIVSKIVKVGYYTNRQ